MQLEKKLECRPYQQDCINAVVAARDANQRKLLIVIPVGGGKTTVVSSLPKALGDIGRTMMLAHREELVIQAASEMAWVNPDLRVGIEMADRTSSPSDDIVIASVPTLAARGGKRLAKFDPSEFSLMVCDEAHHSPAPSYRCIFDHFDAGRSGPLLIGVTATPGRSDGVGLANVYDKVVYEKTIQELMEPDPRDPNSPYLCRLHCWRVDTGTDLSGVHTKQGDYVTSELSESVNTPYRNTLAVRCWQEKTPGKRCVAFCVDVQHAKDMAATFAAEGIPTGIIVGETPTEERRELLRRFAAGEVLVLTSVGVLTEGWNCPQVEVLILARPTQSALLLMQMVGRSTRRFPGKEYATIIDLADTTRNGLPSVTSLLGLPPQWDCQGEDVLKQARQLELIAQEAPEAARKAVTLAEARHLMKEVSLFGDPVAQQQLLAISHLAWIVLPDGSHQLALPDKTIIRVRENLLGRFVATITYAEAGRAPAGDAYECLEAALRTCDAYVRDKHADCLRVVDLKARWREQPATEGQEAMLRKVKRWRDGLTKGEASKILDAVFAKRKDATPARNLGAKRVVNGMEEWVF